MASRTNWNSLSKRDKTGLVIWGIALIFLVLFLITTALSIFVAVSVSGCEYGNFIRTEGKVGAIFQSFWCYVVWFLLGMGGPGFVLGAPLGMFFFGIVFPLIVFAWIFIFINKKLLSFPIAAIWCVVCYFYFTEILFLGVWMLSISA